MIRRFASRVLPLTILLLAVLALPATADEDLGWSDTAEFSYVVTSGNSDSSTLGFRNELTRTWENALFVLKAGAIRAESTAVTQRTAIGSRNDFRLRETSETSLTAESYYLNGRYEQNIGEGYFWFAGLGWGRNRLAGVQNRYIAEGGVGTVWTDTDTVKFKTLYGATYTDQEDVAEGPDSDDGFLGLRFSWEYLHKFGENTTYTNLFVVDENVDNTSDLRADMINSVAVAMSARLALKVSLQLLYDNEPSFTAADRKPSKGTPFVDTVPVQLDDLDTIFTASLVVNF